MPRVHAGHTPSSGHSSMYPGSGPYPQPIHPSTKKEIQIRVNSKGFNHFREFKFKCMQMGSNIFGPAPTCRASTRDTRPAAATPRCTSPQPRSPARQQNTQQYMQSLKNRCCGSAIAIACSPAKQNPQRGFTLRLVPGKESEIDVEALYIDVAGS